MTKQQFEQWTKEIERLRCVEREFVRLLGAISYQMPRGMISPEGGTIYDVRLGLKNTLLLLQDFKVEVERVIALIELRAAQWE